jgi:hypothetical protein
VPPHRLVKRDTAAVPAGYALGDNDQCQYRIT